MNSNGIRKSSHAFVSGHNIQNSKLTFGWGQRKI